MPPPEPLRCDLVERIRRLSRPLLPIPTMLPPQHAPLPRMRAVLFDVYGTLFISAAGDIGSAQAQRPETYQEAAREAGVPLHPAFTSALAASYRATCARLQAAQRGAGVAAPEVDVRRVWRLVLDEFSRSGGLIGPVTDEAIERLAIEVECRCNPVWPMPGARETIAALRARGVRLGLVSNAQFYTPLLFEALLGDTPEALGFEPALCAWSYALGEAKPSSRLIEGVLLNLLEQYGISSSQTLFVGNDLLNDVLPAARSHVRTALFAGDARSLRLREEDARCAGVKPDLVIAALSELADERLVSNRPAPRARGHSVMEENHE
jgi:putative hydrolase of the HAD superfamily